MLNDYLPLVLQGLVAVAFGIAAIGVSLIFGQKGRRDRFKDKAYECGMIADDAPAPRFSVKFYLVAMLFILFDIELVFMYPWAVVYRDMLGLEASGVPNGVFWGMIWFLVLFIVGELYCLKKGAFDWK